MNGLIMDFQLTIPVMMRRAETFFGHKEIVSRLPDKSYHRYTYLDFARRAKRLAVALQKLGLKQNDRVGTFCWNHYQHLEIYFGVPSFGGVLHTLNLRLAADDLTYIVNHGGDRAIVVDEVLLPLFEKFRARIQPEYVIVIPQGKGLVPEETLNYEELVSESDEAEFRYIDLDENQAAAMCYTTGTTGRPKGVLYSHRAIMLHSMASALASTLDIREADTVLPVVPMFHANAWGMPFTSTLIGAKQVFPGPHLDPVSLLEVFEAEKVTITGGVPTIWFGILQALDKEPGKYNLDALRMLIVGGSAVPKAMIKGFKERHHLNVVHAWGMTETAPLGSVASLTSELLNNSEEIQYEYRSKQGLPVPLIEIRGRSEQGRLIPWDGTTMGELEVRGAWVASHYYNTTDMTERFTADGWFCTGDIVTIDSHGFIQIQDRTKDVIKSGGEWISSVALENALMGHPAVAEAAVVAIPHPKWQERPLAAVVLKEGHSVTTQELADYLRPQFDKVWIPDAFEFVKSIPRTAVGKFLKSALREQFKDYKLPVES